MEKYWKNNKPRDAGTAPSVLSEYDRYRQTLVNNRDREGWQAELCHYESDMLADVSPGTDIVMWWQLCLYISTR